MRNLAEGKVKMSGSEIESEQGHEATIFFFSMRTYDISFLHKTLLERFTM